jgi:DNA-binding SARP family transcriptional activator/predicted ATPase
MARLEIALLGAFRVTREGEPAARFETESTRALLAFLVLHAGTPFRREVLADLLWPDEARSKALQVLRQTLSRLQRAIGGREADSPLLEVTRHTIQFDSHGDYWLDADAFTRLAAAIHRHPHRRLEACCTCMQQLTQAAELYCGDLLSGFNLDSLPFQEWLVTEREHFHHQAMETFYHLAACHNQREEYEQAQRYARRQLALEPWREEAQRQLMAALALGGQRSAALAQYETCRRTLIQELGIEPEAETQALCEQIRAGSLCPGETAPHNLPAPLTSFVGREVELERIAEQLNHPDCRLLTLVGLGGVGKTRLALAAARQAAPHFPDGAWFVSLTDVHEEPHEGLHDRLATAIAGALGVTFSGRDDPKTELLGHLRGKEALLVLDGFEHLTSGVDFILELLTRAPKIVVLVTSRARLDVQAERLVQVAGLPVPPQDDDPAAESYGSVQLFVERVKCVAPSFSPDPGQVVPVCRFVEGLPLAIELASTWVEHLPPAEIVAHLQRDVDFLSTTLRDVPERHRRLRAVFESSWRLLAETEQRALAQFAVFRGGFDRAAALSVTEARQDDLIGLADKSLLQHSAPERYTLHALVHQFATEKLEAFPTLAGVSDRHSAYYLAFVAERAAALRGDAPQPATAEIQTELANVRQAWQWAVSQVGGRQGPLPHVTALGESADGLAQFYMQTVLFREGEQTFRAAADPVRALVQEQEKRPLPVEDLALALQALARLLAAQGRFLTLYLNDYPAAVTVLQEADAAFTRAATTWPDRDLATRAVVQQDLGTSYDDMGNHDLAVQHFEAGLSLARQAAAPDVAITVLRMLARMTCEQGDYDTARQRLDEALALARAHGGRIHLARVLAMVSALAWRWGDVTRAEECGLESMAIYQERGDHSAIPSLLNILGILAILQEDYGLAEQRYEEGLTMAQETGERHVMADMLSNLGYIYHHHTGKLEKAKQCYQESLSTSRESGHRQAATSTLCNLGHLHVLLDEHQAAWDCLREALSESTAIGTAPLTLDALVGVARLRAATGRQASAAELLGLALNHPAAQSDSVQLAEAALAGLREALPAKQLEAALERGKGMELDTVVAELLGEG